MTKAKGALRPAEDNKPKKPKLKKNEGSNAADSERTVIGQEVHGVVDGSFDAGYLLTVKVGDSPLVLRGLVFAPGMLAPLSNGNDIAPTIKATTRDQQVGVPTSAQLSPVAENLCPAARPSSTAALTPSQAPQGTSQEHENEGHAASFRMPSAERMHTGPDHPSLGGDNPLISEKDYTEQGNFMMNERGQVHDSETDINVVMERRNVKQSGYGGTGPHTTEALEAGLQRPFLDACAHNNASEAPLDCKDVCDDQGPDSNLQEK